MGKFARVSEFGSYYARNVLDASWNVTSPTKIDVVETPPKVLASALFLVTVRRSRDVLAVITAFTNGVYKQKTTKKKTSRVDKKDNSVALTLPLTTQPSGTICTSPKGARRNAQFIETSATNKLLPRPTYDDNYTVRPRGGPPSYIARPVERGLISVTVRIISSRST